MLRITAPVNPKSPRNADSGTTSPSRTTILGHCGVTGPLQQTFPSQLGGTNKANMGLDSNSVCSPAVNATSAMLTNLIYSVYAVIPQLSGPSGAGAALTSFATLPNWQASDQSNLSAQTGDGASSSV